MSQDSDENQPEAKLFTQEEVNKLVGGTRVEAKERARRELEQDYQRKLEEQRAAMQAQFEQPKQPQAQGSNLDMDAIKQQIIEEMNQRQMAEQQQREQEMLHEQVQLAAQNYLNHMGKAAEKYADFEEITRGYDPHEFPELTFLLSQVDGAGDVVYDLSKNQDKLEHLGLLAKQYPKRAEAALKRLGNSISQNEKAVADAHQNNVPAPLDRL